MIKNYFRIALRGLARNKVHSFINIAGLSIGMAVSLLISGWVWDELSFNTWHQRYDRIAQVMVNEQVNGTTKSSAMVPYPLSVELAAHYRDHFARLVTASPKEEEVLSTDEKKITLLGQYLEREGPALFTLDMLKGSRDGLNDPHSILLSAAAAKAFFGDTDPMGRVLQIGDSDRTVRVTGVYADLPANTYLHDVKFFSSWELLLSTNANMKKKKWDNHALLIYAEIPSRSSIEQVTAVIRNAEKSAISGLDNMKAEAATNPQLWLHPMKNWHLYSAFRDGVAESGPIQFVRLVGLIGVFVLLLACINFMNLSTARSEKRAREVGIRKTIGSGRGGLIGLFLSESLLVVLFAFLLAIGLVVLTLPAFNRLAAKEISLPWTSLPFWGYCIVFILFTALLAGSYPAFYLSSFQPVKVLKGKWVAGSFSSLPRKILVVLQFTISTSLIICTIVVYKEVLFAKDRPVGYTREGLILIPMNSRELYSKYEVLKNDLKNTGMVREVSRSQSPVTAVLSSNSGLSWRGKLPGTHENFATLDVSSEYGPTVGWDFKEGRNFLGDRATDSSGFIINESAARYMGMSHPVGETIHWKAAWGDIDKDFVILGVIKDMVMQSPFEEAAPTVFWLGPSPYWYNFINIRIDPAASKSRALVAINAVFKNLIFSVPFEYKFAEEEYALKFATEERIGRLVTLFAVLAIVISCLGLFGMALFMTEQRSREIGVRKVLGASVIDLLKLLSREFVLLVLISLAIAIPAAACFMYHWLQGHSYHTGLPWWAFAGTALGILVLTLLTVSFQSLKAALANPVKSLRSE